MDTNNESTRPVDAVAGGIDISCTVVDAPSSYVGIKYAILPYKILIDKMSKNLIDNRPLMYMYKKDNQRIEEVITNIIKNAICKTIKEVGTDKLIGTKYFLTNLLSVLSKEYDKDYYPYQNSDKFFEDVIDSYMMITDSTKYELIDPHSYFLRLYSYEGDNSYSGMPLHRFRGSLFSDLDVGVKYYDITLTSKFYEVKQDDIDYMSNYFKKLCIDECEKFFSLMISKLRSTEDSTHQVYGIITSSTYLDMK